MLTSKRFVWFVATAAIAAYIGVYTTGRAGDPIRSDGYSYYVYLPAWFLHHDPSLQAVADDCCGGSFPAFTSIVRWPETRRWVDPHPIGVALLMLPLFAVAHLLTWWSNLPPDGFSLYYQHAAGLSGVAAFVAGLFFLRRLLARWFSEGVVLATLAAIVFGTNLFHYGTFDSAFSHAFSFALVAALLDITDRWWQDDRWAASLQLAVVAALLFLTRHPNMVYLLVVPFWKPQALWARRVRLAQVACLAAFCAAPQLLIYRLATGHWFVSVYGELGHFDWASPRIAAVLFGTQKGLFFWTPMLLIAIAGAFVNHPLVGRIRAAALLSFAFTVYVIASWSDWQFGGSFGHRGFTDSLAIAAVFIAAFFDWSAQRPPLRVPVAVVTAVMCLLSTAQMIQYWMGIIPIADTTWSQYKDVFLRFQ